MKRKININTSKKESNHFGSVDLIRLIEPNQISGKVATMNYAWLKKGKTVETHQHKDGSEYYLFLKGRGEMLIDNEWFEVTPGDFITVSMNLKHGLKNLNKDTLEFVTLRTIE